MTYIKDGNRKKKKKGKKGHGPIGGMDGLYGNFFNGMFGWNNDCMFESESEDEKEEQKKLERKEGEIWGPVRCPKNHSNKSCSKNLLSMHDVLNYYYHWCMMC